MARRGPWGIRSLAYTFLVVSFLLLAQLARSQLIVGEDLAIRARDQRMEQVVTVPARGAILDRDSKVLAGASYHRRAIVVFPRLVRDPDAVASMLTLLGGIPRDEALSRLDLAGPLRLVAPAQALGAAPAQAFDDPGVAVVEEPMRYSPDGLAVHAIGHLDAMGERGVSGIEELLDSQLRGGRPGAVAAFVDAKRRLIHGLGIREVPGKPRGADVRLTIDRDVQAHVERVMDDNVERGAVVVMDPRTGDVLALASRPRFAPDDPGASLASPHSPMLNRAITAYPVGSVFKVVVAAAAIEGRVAALNARFLDPGYIDVGGRRFECYAHEEGGHGEITFLDAMAYSCNTVFVQTGLEVGGAAIVKLAEALGFGATTGVGLPGEDRGVLPDPTFMSAQDVANLSIGQGRLLATPLQVAAMMSAIASGGRLPRPRLVMETLSEDPELARVFRPMPSLQVLSADTCRQLTFTLEAVTRWGTGTSAWVDGAGACGKTGTAETGRLDETGAPVSHAWFAGFTPLDGPRLVIVVFVEEGGSGGTSAAPVFAEIARCVLHVLPHSS